MKVLVLNPGATSTKISIFEEENEVFKTNLVHHAADLAPYAHVIDQGPFRKQLILETVEKAGYQMTDFDAVCGRGGLLRHIPSGTYAVSDQAIADVLDPPYGEHASNLGVLLARELGDMAGIPSFFVDPVCVDEMTPVAHVTGFKGMERESFFHALNQKSIARKAAKLLGKTYDVARPEVVLVWLENAPRPGVGPQDIAIALIGAVFKNGFVKNRVMEFAGPGVAGLSVEYRCGIDVMTTETTCLSSIWTTDDKVRDYLALHGRADDYTELRHDKPACFDRCIRVDLSTIEPMMALPFHPSNAYPVAEVVRHADELFAAVEEEARKQFGKAGEGLQLRAKIHDGGVWVDQGIIAGCAGGSFENCCMAASILDGRSTGCGEFSLSVYPASEPQAIALVRNGAAAKLMAAGAVIKNAFCGPCFGAGDTPANGALSIRHSTRNFPNREGSKPGNGQISAVALMDARSIAATAANGGRLTPATELDWDTLAVDTTYTFDAGIYQRRVYNGFGKADAAAELKRGPNIADWPSMSPLPENLVLPLASVITDPVTTTDELIPSGETSSLRSNPLKLSEFTLSRKDPAYVGRA